MTISKKINLFGLLFVTVFSATTSQLMAVQTKQAKKNQEQNKKEKRSFKQTWSKVARLKWSELDKKDVWNIFLTTAAVGGTYATYRGVRYYVFNAQERRDREFAERMQRQYYVEQPQNFSAAGEQLQRHSQSQRQQHHDPRPRVTTPRVVLERNVECSVCFEDFDVLQEINQLTCNHRFCVVCLRGQIDTALGERNLPICPHNGCNHQLTEREVLLITNNDRQVRQRYDQACLRRYVSSQLGENDHAIFCPGANCQMFWVRERNQRLTLRCSECSTRFCSDCQHDHNQNITCEQAARQTSETNNWIRDNTKPCPQCHVRVERSAGCNYMRCTQCRAHFCWTCGERAVDGRSLAGGCDSFRCATQNRRVWG